MKGARVEFLAGTGSLAIGAVASMLTQLILLGPILRIAGVGVLGEWSLVMAVVGLLSVVDTGLQAAVSRFSADCVRMDVLGVVRRLFRVAVTISVVFVAIVALALAVIQRALPPPAGDQGSTAALWLWVPLILLGQMLSGQARAASIGVGRSGSVGLFDVFGNGVLLCVTPLALSVSPSVEAIAWGLLARSVFLLVSNTVVMFRATAHREHEEAGRNDALAILRFATPVTLTAVLGASFFNIPKLILGAMAGVDAVGAFEAVNRFAFAALFVVQPVLANALPSLTRVRDDEERALRMSTALRGGVVVLTSVVSAIMIVVSVGTIDEVLASVVPAHVPLWVGPQCLSYSLIALTGVATTYLRSVQRQWIEFFSLAIALVALMGLLLVGLGRSPLGVAGAMVLASTLYLCSLRLFMWRADCGGYAPRFADLAVPYASIIVATGISAEFLQGATSTVSSQWTWVFIAAFASGAAAGMMTLISDPSRSAVYEVLHVTTGFLRTRCRNGAL